MPGVRFELKSAGCEVFILSSEVDSLNLDSITKANSKESTKIAIAAPKPSIRNAVNIFSYEIGMKGELSHVLLRSSV